MPYQTEFGHKKRKRGNSPTQEEHDRQDRIKKREVLDAAILRFEQAKTIATSMGEGWHKRVAEAEVTVAEANVEKESEQLAISADIHTINEIKIRLGNRYKSATVHKERLAAATNAKNVAYDTASAETLRSAQKIIDAAGTPYARELVDNIGPSDLAAVRTKVTVTLTRGDSSAAAACSVHSSFEDWIAAYRFS